MADATWRKVSDGEAIAVVPTGSAASGATDSGNPIKVGGVNNTSLPTLTNGQRGDLQLDTNGRLITLPSATYLSTPPTLTNATSTSLQSDTNGNLKITEDYSFSNITTNTTTVVKSGAGYVSHFTVNNPGKFTVAELVITVYDNTSAAGTKIGTWTMPVVATAQSIPPQILNCKFGTGLTVVTSGPTVAANITFYYR